MNLIIRSNEMRYDTLINLRVRLINSIIKTNLCTMKSLYHLYILEKITSPIVYFEIGFSPVQFPLREVQWIIQLFIFINIKNKITMIIKREVKIWSERKYNWEDTLSFISLMGIVVITLKDVLCINKFNTFQLQLYIRLIKS
jgi:hypothetical protein